MRPVFAPVCIILNLLLAACQPVMAPTPSPTFSEATIPAAAATLAPTAANPLPTLTRVSPPTSAPTLTAAPPESAETLQFYEGNPVLSGEHAWDRVYIDPGAIVFHDGLFHMFYNGIAGFPSPVGVGYATSQDGLHWQTQVSEPLFHASDLFPNDDKIVNLFVTSGLVQPDGLWVLYFYTLHGGNFVGPQEIGRVTSRNPKGPWKADPQFTLRPGPVGAWDSLQVGSPDVLSTPNGFVMFFDGMNSGGPGMIGQAISSDGIHWTKHKDPNLSGPAFAESSPVLLPDESGWDSKRVIDPNVLQDGNGWKMIFLSTTCTSKFGGCDYNLGQAKSKDGIHWEKAQASPILSSQDHPDWKATYLVTVVQREGNDFVYMDYSGIKDSGTRVFLAAPKN